MVTLSASSQQQNRTQETMANGWPAKLLNFMDTAMLWSSTSNGKV